MVFLLNGGTVLLSRRSTRKVVSYSPLAHRTESFRCSASHHQIMLVLAVGAVSFAPAARNAVNLGNAAARRHQGAMMSSGRARLEAGSGGGNRGRVRC